MYQPKHLKESTSVSITHVAQRVSSKSVVIVVGAGVSIPPPTSLPSGNDIATTLKDKLSRTGLAKYVNESTPDDLLDIVDAVVSPSSDALQVVQKMILESFEFTTAPWNYAHLAITLLMAEGVIQVLSTNWDTCIERAADMSYLDIVPCRELSELRGAQDSAILIKLHGCAKIENSIVVSTRQFTRSPWWVTSQVSALFARNLVIFVGIGSIPRYVGRTVSLLLDFAKDSRPIIIVAPHIDQEWDNLLRDHKEPELVTCSAEEFLDDVLRALITRQLSEVDILIRQMKGSLTDIDIESATKEVIDILLQCPAHFIWLWMRRCIFPYSCDPTVLSPTFINCIIAIALLSTISPLQEIKMTGDVVFVRCKHFLVELAWAKRQMISNTLRRKKISSLQVDIQRGLLPENNAFIILAQGSVGSLPPPTMPLSILNEPCVNDIIEGAGTLAEYWVSLDSLLRVQDRDTLSRTIGFAHE